MSKPKQQRRLEDNQATASVRALRVSPRKLGLVAGLIRDKHVSDALASLEKDPKRVSGDVKKLLLSAVANAENVHGLDIDALYVTEVMVGKSYTMKRMIPRAKGRGSRIEKPFSRLSITLTEI